MHSRKIRGALCALVGGVLWACSGTVWQYLSENYKVNSEWMTTARLMGAGVLLLILALLRRVRLSEVWSERSNAIRLVLFAVIGLMTVQLTYIKAIAYSNSATATALEYLGQALIMAVTCVKLSRLPTAREWAAVLLALGGVVLLSTHGNFSTLVLSPKALFWGLAAAVSLMLYTLLPVNMIRRYGNLPVTGFGMLIGGVALCVITGAWRHMPGLDLRGWLCAAFVVVIGTAVAFTLYLQGVSDIGAVPASLIACIEPVCAAVLTTLWLKTPLVMWDYVAFAMIIIMAVLLALPQSGAKEPVQPES